MLLEIEEKIEFADAYILEEQIDPQNRELFKQVLATVKKAIKTERAEEDTKKREAENEANKRRQEEKQKDRHVPRDVRRGMQVSIKSKVHKPEVKAPSFTQSQLDMRKYGGEQLF